MIEQIHTLPVEEVVGGISRAASTARQADAELTLALTYAHRVMSPPLSLRVLSSACGLSPSTIRARVQAPGALEALRTQLGRAGHAIPALDTDTTTGTASAGGDHG